MTKKDFPVARRIRNGGLVGAALGFLFGAGTCIESAFHKNPYENNRTIIAYDNAQQTLRELDFTRQQFSPSFSYINQKVSDYKENTKNSLDDAVNSVAADIKQMETDPIIKERKEYTTSQKNKINLYSTILWFSLGGGLISAAFANNYILNKQKEKFEKLKPIVIDGLKIVD